MTSLVINTTATTSGPLPAISESATATVVSGQVINQTVVLKAGTQFASNVGFSALVMSVTGIVQLTATKGSNPTYIDQNVTLGTTITDTVDSFQITNNGTTTVSVQLTYTVAVSGSTPITGIVTSVNGTSGAVVVNAANLPGLATVAKTGAYSDLGGKPVLAVVATSGSYNDLLNKPSIPGGQVNADWNSTSGVTQILNKPTLATVATSGAYSDLTGKPVLAAVATSGAYSDLSGKPVLATVAISGSYTDLSNTPTIPPAQVNSDWNAVTGVAQILNKPTTFNPPIATASVLGGVKIGSGVQVAGDGTISVNLNTRTSQTAVATANGQSVFTFTTALPAGQTDAYLIGTYLEYGVDYTSSGVTVTLDPTVASKVVIGDQLIVNFTSSVPIADAVQATVLAGSGGAALVGTSEGPSVQQALDTLNSQLNKARTVTVVAATSVGQSVFPVPGGYPINLIDVDFVGGHLINGIDYTATDGQNIVLTSALAAQVQVGNNLSIEAFGSFNVANAAQLTTLGATGGATLIGTTEGPTVQQTLDTLNSQLNKALTVQVVAATTAGQSVFPIPLGYPVNLIDVNLGTHLINGVDYSATDGQNIVLVPGVAAQVQAGDNLSVEAFGSFNVANAAQLTTLGASGGAALIGYGTQTVKQALDAVTPLSQIQSIAATASTASVAPIVNGTWTNVSSLAGTETVPLSGQQQTTTGSIAGFISGSYVSVLAGMNASRTLAARLTDRQVSLAEFYLPATTDDQAWTAALSYCSTNGKDLYVPYRTSVYTWTTAKVYNYHNHGVFCESGVRIYATGIVGPALQFQSLFSDATGSQNAFKHKWTGSEMYGDKVTGNHAIFFGDPTTTTYTGLLACIENMAIHDFDNGMGFGNNAAQMSFKNLTMWSLKTVINFPSGLTNSGENIAFNSCQFLNSTQLVSNAGADLNFMFCSFDYFTNYAISCTNGGRCVVIGGHAEFSSDGDVAFKTSGSQSTIIIDGCLRIMLTGSNRANYLFNGGNSDGGVIARSVSINAQSGTAYATQSFGTGYSRVDNQTVLSIGNSANAYDFNRTSRSTAQSLLVDGGFEDTLEFAWNLTDWHFVNTSNSSFSTDTSTFHSGTRSLKLKPANGTSFKMVHTVPCGPGAMPGISGWMKNSIANATDKITLTIAYCDNSGQSQVTSISAPTSSFQWSQSNQNANWTLFNWCAFAPAPAGTAYCQISFNGSSTDGLTTHWLDDLIIDVTNDTNPAHQYASTRNLYFVPVVSGTTTAGAGSGGSTYARGTLVGQRFTFQMQINWLTHTGAGNMFIQGLPFLPDYVGNVPCTINLSGIPFTSGNVPQAYVSPQSANITITQVNPTTGAESSVPLPTSGLIRITGSYDIF
jgi:hypothetical protein